MPLFGHLYGSLTLLGIDVSIILRTYAVDLVVHPISSAIFLKASDCSRRGKKNNQTGARRVAAKNRPFLPDAPLRRFFRFILCLMNAPKVSDVDYIQFLITSSF